MNQGDKYFADATNYVMDLIGSYRSVGLFRKYEETTNEDLIKRIREYLLKEFDFDMEELYAKMKLRKILDILILTFDTERVWLRETKENVSIENKTYEDILFKWSKISEGKFPVESVREIWNEEEELIYVDVVSNGVYKRMELEILPGILDIGNLVKQINETFDMKNYEFNVIGLEDIALVILLTEEERNILEIERELTFVSTEELEGFPPAKMGVYLKHFKKIYNKWRFFEFSLFLIAVIDLSYFLYKGLCLAAQRIGQKMVTTGCYIIGSKPYWILVSVMIGVVFAAYIARNLMHPILKEKNEGYRVYLQLFWGEGEMKKGILKYISIFICFSSVILIFLGMNWYILFTENEIIINPLLSFKPATYRYTEVQSIKKVEEVDAYRKNFYGKSHIEIYFQYGSTKWSSSYGKKTPVPNVEEQIIKLVSEKSGKTVETLP